MSACKILWIQERNKKEKYYCLVNCILSTIASSDETHFLVDKFLYAIHFPLQPKNLKKQLTSGSFGKIVKSMSTISKFNLCRSNLQVQKDLIWSSKTFKSIHLTYSVWMTRIFIIAVIWFMQRVVISDPVNNVIKKTKLLIA